MSSARLDVLLRRRGLKLAVAESCTGGLIGHMITNVPGASTYFLGDVVAYDNDVKMKLLGVKESTLLKHGAVSEECAREMVNGVVKLFHADVGIATTGIAGPGGGTKEKPVGLVYIAVKSPEGCRVNRYLFSGSREEVKRQTAEQALRDALEFLEK